MHGYRKFFVVIFIDLIATILIFWGKIPPEVFQQIIIWTAGLYLGSNAVSNVGSKAAEHVKITTRSDTPPVLEINQNVER